MSISYLVWEISMPSICGNNLGASKVYIVFHIYPNQNNLKVVFLPLTKHLPLLLLLLTAVDVTLNLCDHSVKI